MKRPIGLALASVALVAALQTATAAACSDSPKPGSSFQAGPDAVVAPIATRGLLIARDAGVAARPAPEGPESIIAPLPPTGGYVTYPRWSPDGTQLAYSLNTPGTGGQDWGNDLIVTVASTGGQRAVWRHGTPGETIEGLAWAPDGTAIYQSVYTPRIVDGRAVGSSLRLLRVDLATGATTPIVDGAAFPDVSPDGRRIAFLSFSSGPRPAGIWTAAPDGSDQRLIVPVPSRFAGVRWPRFSPDGARIAFGAVEADLAATFPAPCDARSRRPWSPRVADAHGPPTDLWVVPANGGLPEQIAALREDDPYIAWSPDGASVAAIGACGLYLIPITGGKAQSVGPGSERSQIDWR